MKAGISTAFKVVSSEMVVSTAANFDKVVEYSGNGKWWKRITYSLNDE